MSKLGIQSIIEELANHHEGFNGLMDRYSFMSLLRLLEHPYAEVVANLHQSFLNAGLTESDYNRASLKGLIVFALQSSDYWAGLSVQWLEDGFPMESEIVGAIDAMVAHKSASQSLRHRAYRLARRWERSKQAGHT